MIDRRHFLGGSAALAVAAGSEGVVAQATPSTRLTALFDTLVQEQLRRSPEAATNLGLDTGANADLRSHDRPCRPVPLHRQAPDRTSGGARRRGLCA